MDKKKPQKKPARSPSTPLYVRLDVDLAAEFDAFVEAYQEREGLKVTMTAHIERAIREYIAKYRLVVDENK